MSSTCDHLGPEWQPAHSATALPGGNRCWYAIRTQSKFENLVSTALRGKGYQEFLPLYHSRRRWSDRIKELDLPLFPGYVFCRFDVRERLLPILTTPGVVSILGAGKTPVPVSDDEIAAVQAIVRSGLPARPWPCLTFGSRVLIEYGPLAGLEGFALRVDKVFRLVVSVQLLQRAVAVEIDRDCVRPILNGSGPRKEEYPRMI
ncbi:MAG: transcription termination/antitermination protein NusG [Bryobacteraceae bacterium]